MSADLNEVQAELLAAVNDAGDLQTLEAARVAAVGRKGRVGQLMQALGGMPPEERKGYGQAVNALKTAVEQAIEARKTDLEASAMDARLAAERVDVTLPVRPESQGRIHPISQTMDEIVQIFGQMGFSVAEGPDIEDDWKNFTALNIPYTHGEDKPSPQLLNKTAVAFAQTGMLFLMGRTPGGPIINRWWPPLAAFRRCRTICWPVS